MPTSEARSQPRVTVVTAVYNGIETVADTITSVHSQDYPGIEYIVIDGKSTDGTVEAVQAAGDRVDRFVSEKDNGVYDAMNKGIRLATGDIVSTLNADDVYSGPSTVSEMVRLMESNGLDAAYADLVYVDPRDLDRVIRYWKTGEYRPGSFRYGWVPPHPTFFCRRRVYEEHGYYLDHYRVAADFEFMLRVFERHRVRVGYLPKVTVRMRAGGRSNIASSLVGQNREILDALQRNGLRRSPFFFISKPLLKVRQFLRKPGPADFVGASGQNGKGTA